MSGCVYRTADNQCQKYSDPIRNTMSWCVGNEPCEGRTPSNADHIRGMSDEELARELSMIETGVRTYRTEVFDHWLDWLKEEAKI